MAQSTLLPDPKTVSFARDLVRFGDRTALFTEGGEVSYRALAGRVEDTARRLGDERRLVLLAGENTIDAIVVYLAALSAGHPVLLVPGDSDDAVQTLIDTYDPDIVARRSENDWRFKQRRAEPQQALHSELALLLSTSGSTGSPKLVRLSYENLQSNAESIADYLDIRESDRAATTLPMHYCYGLSVINSHLLRGAGLILTDLSVVDPCFWRLFADRRGTSFAGVPYTFDLLDRVGFADMRLPHLRYVTQAGGRLAPDRVASYAALGRQQGWDLFVMYGQTEATARMAFLPPRLAQSHPRAIGMPIPGGSFELQPVPESPEPATGELVYCGPNVMLGYAEGPADLGLGRTVTDLRTGDLARRTADGLYELVGRRSQFAKILGLRIDPSQVEAMLAREGIAALCAGGDGELVVAVTGAADAGTVRRLVAAGCGVPGRAVRVCTFAELPRLATGKPDYNAVRDGARTNQHSGRTAVRSRKGQEDLCRLYAEILDRTDVSEASSFVELGGDSLSYVEMSIRLEQALGHLPADWHIRSIRELASGSTQHSRELAGAGQCAPKKRRALETSVALRALSICLIVGTHAQLFAISGGAHLLLAVAGFNFARFQLTDAPRTQRLRSIGTSIRRIAVPSVIWIGLALLVTADYTVAQVFLVNYIAGPTDRHNHYWFIEAVVYILAFLCAIVALPRVDRLERRFRFGLPFALMLLGLITRYQLVPGVHVRAPAVLFWLVAMGWAAARATATWQRLAVTVAILATMPGFFGDPRREAVVMLGVAVLVWLPTIPGVGPVNRAAGMIAGASLYIYLTHWQVFPLLDQYSSALALVGSLVFGIGYTALARRAAVTLVSLGILLPPEGRKNSKIRQFRPRRRGR